MISFGLKVTMRWWDPRIKTNLIHTASKKGQIALSIDAINKIWTPDLAVLDQTSLKPKDEWISFASAKVFSLTNFEGFGEENTLHANIEAIYQIKATVFCEFDHSRYPMDKQYCNVSFGSSSFGTIFVQEDTSGKNDRNIKYSASTFKIETRFFDNKQHDSGKNTIGMSYELTHSINAYLFKYYIPCMLIVIVSMIAFAIPLTAIPGRVALLVTQFLTFTNLFIYEMVTITIATIEKS